ncbi:MAG: Ig-like domain-containing protein [Chitinophagales bacterium]
MNRRILSSVIVKCFILTIGSIFWLANDAVAQEVCDESFNYITCAEPITEIELCPEVCLTGAYEITAAHTTFDCSIEIFGTCFTYIPLPGLTGTDEITVTACLTDNPDECVELAAFVHLLTDCTDFNPDDVPCEVQTTNIGTCSEVGSFVEVCPDFCLDDFSITETTASLHPENISIIDNCIRYEITTAFTGTDILEITACDSGGECNVAQINILAAPCAQNNPPEGTSDLADSENGATVTIDLLANDSDPDGDALHINNFSNPNDGIVTIDDNGIATYTPNVGFEGLDSFTYEVCDEANACDLVSVTIQVLDNENTGNNAPNGENDSAVSDNGAAVTIDLLANDSDPDGDVLGISNFGEPSNGTLDINGNGSITYTPNENFEGTDSFTYQVCDEENACDLVSVNIEVINNSNTGGGSEDPCSEEYAFHTCTQPITLIEICPEVCLQGGYAIEAAHTTFDCSIELLGTCFTYIPLPGMFGTDEVTVTACLINDPEFCDEITVFVHLLEDCSEFEVTPTNNPPIASNDSATSDNGSSVEIDLTANDIDPNGDDFSITANSNPTNGDLVLNGDIATYTPNENFEGTDTFTYEICDTAGACNTATVSINVINNSTSNNPPTAIDDFATSNNGNSISINVLDNDFHENNIAFDLTSNTMPANGTLVFTGDLAIYSPNDNFEGMDMFTYEICDNNGLCDEATVAIEVMNNTTENNPPVAVADEGSSVGGETITLNVTANDSDPDGDLFEIGTISTPSNGSATILDVNGEIVYTPNANFEGIDSFEYSICDEFGACASATISVTVTENFDPTNNAPIAENDDIASDGGTSTSIDPLSNDSDPDGDNLVLGDVGDAENGEVLVSDDDVITYTPDEGFEGTDSFTYEVCDEEGACVVASIFIQVTDNTFEPTNLPPNAVDDFGTSDEGNAAIVMVLDNDSDPENNALSFGNIGTPSNGSVIINAANNLIYTPNAGFEGEDSFTYEVCDEFSECATATVTITVTNNIIGEVNLAPTAQDDLGTSDNGSSVTINLLANDFDPNSDILVVQSFGNPFGGSIEIVNGIMTYTPNAGFEGEDSFNYQACDPEGLCNTASVTIQVINNATEGCNTTTQMCVEPMTALQICPDFCSFSEDEQITINSLYTSYNCVVNDLGDGCLEYRSLPMFAGQETITVIAQNNFGLLDTAYIIVAVANCDDSGGDNSDDTGKLIEDNDEIALDIIGQKLTAQSLEMAIATSSLNTQIDIYDLQGQHLSHETLATQKGINEIQMNISAYASGMYLVNIQNETGRVSTKFIKH